MQIRIDLSTRHSSRIQVTWGMLGNTEFQYAVREIKAIGGAKFVGKDKGGPYWHLPLELGVCRDLRTAFGDSLVVSKRLGDWARSDLARKEKAATLIRENDATLDLLPQVRPELAEYLRDYQRAASAFIRDLKVGGLIADQPGLGKTIETLAGIVESGMLEGSHLIMAPKSSLGSVWGATLEQWGLGEVFVCLGTSAKKKKILEAFQECDAETKWLVTNPEMVRGKVEELDEIDARTGNFKKIVVSKYPWMYEVPWSSIIVDECHKGALRDPKRVTAVSLQGLPLRDGGRKIALSGTPMKNKGVDLWGILHWLDPVRWSSKWEFAGRYCEIEDNGFGKVIHGIRKDREEELWLELSTLMLRRTKHEVAKDLPPKQYVDVWCELTDTQKRQYEQMKKNAEVRLADGSLISATTVLTELLRLKQFAIARFDDVDDENGKPHGPTEDSGKLVRLRELLAERDIFEDPVDPAEAEKAIVFSQFSQVTMMVANALAQNGASVAVITGKFSGFITQHGRQEASREEVQEKFQADGGPNVICMTTTAGGVAITLDRADSVFFMDETWSPADMEQAEDRAHRISRIHNVTIYILRSIGTVDEEIKEVVRDKSDMASAVLDHYRSKLLADYRDAL